MAKKNKSDNYNFNEILLYDSVTLQDVLKEIHLKTAAKSSKIESFIDKILEFVNDSDTATMLSPILASYMDSSIKNDDTLIKLVNVVQRLTKTSVNDSKGASGDTYDTLLTPGERDEILKNARESTKIIKM